MREIVLDIETTGLSYQSGDKIIDIACVELLNFLPTGKVYQTYINPIGRSVGNSIKIHNLSDEFLKDKKNFKEVIPEFLNFIKDSPLIAHNGLAFDIPFLNHELKSNNLNMIKNPIIDTLHLSKKKFPSSPVNLDALCRRFDVDLSIRKEKHSALIDTKLLAKVYLELKGGQQPNLILDQKNEEKNDNNKILKKNKLKIRDFILSDDEKGKHKEFLKKIKNPIWNQYN